MAEASITACSISLYLHRIGPPADEVVYIPGTVLSQFDKPTRHGYVCQVDILRRRAIFGASISFDSLWKMPDQFNEELGRRIRAAREGKLTQETLGSRIGLSRTAVTNIECGRQRLLVDQLVDIAAAIGVPPSDLLPSAGVSPPAAKADIGINEMPTVQRWITSVRKTAPRGRR